MKKIVIFGASGKTGKYIVRELSSLNDVELTLFVRTPSKLEGIDLTDIKVIQGDALNQADVKKRC